MADKTVQEIRDNTRQIIDLLTDILEELRSQTEVMPKPAAAKVSAS